MRTTLSIDDSIIHQVMSFTGENNPVSAIRHALQDYQRKIKLLALRGQVQIEDNWVALRQLDAAPDAWDMGEGRNTLQMTI